MDKEHLSELIAPRDRQFESPGCLNADTLWSEFLRSSYALKNPLYLKSATIYTADGTPIDAEILMASGRIEIPGALVIRPYPGLIVADDGSIVRPLLKKPVFTNHYLETLRKSFKRFFDIDSASSTWYVDGMIRLLRYVAEDVDIDVFRGILEVYETSFKPDPVHYKFTPKGGTGR